MDKKTQLDQVFVDLAKIKTSLPLGDSDEPIVPGIGDPLAKIMFIGEAPGYYESIKREPFVGRSGQLFTQVIENLGIARKSVYISNIVKIRPPENRDPLPEEILAFKPFLDREIMIIDPEIIVTLGRFSMAKFLPEVRISQVHGRLHRVNWQEKKLNILPMYHPAAALRSTQLKLSFEADFAKLPKIMTWLAEQEKLTLRQDEVLAALG